MSNIIKRTLEYIIIILLCAIVSSLVFAYEFEEFDNYLDQQLILNSQMVKALEMLAENQSEMQDRLRTMRGI